MYISILSLCIVLSNHFNIIVGMFVCPVYFICQSNCHPVSPYLFICYVISHGALDDARQSTMAPWNPGWETLHWRDASNSILYVYILIWHHNIIN